MGDMGHTFSVRKAAHELGISKLSVHRILKQDLGLNSYRYSLHQELNEDDPNRRLFFCEHFINIFQHNPRLLDQITWSDEASFCLDGTVNRHNSVYWSDQNRHLLHTKSLNQRKLTVWAAISTSGVSRPYFFDNTVNGENYLAMLQEFIPTIPRRGIFMQDGAPPHFYRPVIEYLNNQLPGRWMGRRVNFLEWPARSPDLTPCDFFLWGYVKEKVYQASPQNLADLRTQIEEVFNGISPKICRRVCHQEVRRRLHLCIAENGGHIENKL